MKNKFKMIAAGAVAALVGFSATVQAIPISGQISFVGSATLGGPVGWDGTLPTATKFTAYTGLTASSPQVSVVTGSYAVVPILTAALFTPFTFNPANFSTPFQLWSFTIGSTVYSFNVNTVVSTFSNGSLNISGTGFANILGGGSPYTQTAGKFTITDTGVGPTFTFGSTTTVPDGGTTVMLLGAALSGFALLRKKLTA